jgi:hypothetical protein
MNFLRKLLKKILKFAKSTKDISNFNKNLNNTIEKPKINFKKKIGNKINLFENNNEKIESNDKKKILNFVKICQTKLPPKMISIYLDILIISFKK